MQTIAQPALKATTFTKKLEAKFIASYVTSRIYLLNVWIVPLPPAALIANLNIS